MSLRARTRNSSGGVAESRKPARLSATSGWLLTFSGTVVLDQQLQGIHRDAKHAVHVLRVQMMDLARAQLVDAQVDRARTQLADASDDEQRRRLHIVAKHAGARPHRQLIAQLMPPRHAVGNEVRVERVNRPDDPDVVGRARRLRGVDERVHDVERRNCRVLEGDVAVGRALGANRSDADDEVAHLDLGLRGAARAHAQEGVHPELAQLFDTDRHGWPSHTGRDGRDRDAEQAAGERAVLAAERDLAGAVQVLGDQRRPARIAWNQYVLSDLAFREPYVVFLLPGRRHRIEVYPERVTPSLSTRARTWGGRLTSCGLSRHAFWRRGMTDRASSAERAWMTTSGSPTRTRAPTRASITTPAAWSTGSSFFLRPTPSSSPARPTSRASIEIGRA